MFRFLIAVASILGASAAAQMPSALDDAIAASEPPPTLRIAFLGRLQTQTAWRDIHYDARRPRGDRFSILRGEGEDAELDAIVQDWSADAAPDGRLWADQLRSRLAKGGRATRQDGRMTAWFAPATTVGDAPLDTWMASHLSGRLTLDEDARFVEQIQFTAERAIDLGGARVTEFAQVYDLDIAPIYDVAFVRRFTLQGEGWSGWRTEARVLRFELLEADFHMATDAEQSLRTRP